MVAEQGWHAIAIPESAGGYGCSWMELSVVFEELGRSLTPSPLLGTACAIAALLDHGSALGRLAEGETGALGLDPVAASWDGERLQGTWERVVDGSQAQWLVLGCADGVFVVEGARVERQAQPSLDATRDLARVRVDLEIEAPFSVDDALLRARCAVLVAAESVGAAEATLEMALDYGRVRKQFGRPIGSFQAIQHKCADMLVKVESARSAVWYAAWAVSTGAEDALLAAHTGKAMASDALFRCAAENIQIHGGIGFTEEHNAHRYFKRARSAQALFGDPRDHREAVATHLLGAGWI